MIQMTVTGKESLDAAKAKIAQARARLKDSHPVMMRVSVYLDQWVQRNFKSEGGNVGSWTPFKYGGRITTKAKATGKSDGRYINASAKLLQDAGHLRISFLPGVREGEAYIGSDLPYSRYHEEGTAKLPQRRMLPNQDDVKGQVSTIFDNWIVASLKGAT